MNVLLVGTNEAVTGVIGQALGKIGYRTRIASGPESARRLLSQERVDVVVIDVDDVADASLPLSQWIRSRAALRNLPLVFIASGCDPEMIQQAAALGEVDFLIKPIKHQTLRARMERLVWVGAPNELGCAAAKRAAEPPVISLDPGDAAVEEFAFRLSNVLQRSAVRLYRLLATPENCTAGVRNLATGDHGLRAAILARVNDPTFGLHRRITQTGEACALLSAREIAMCSFKKSVIQPDGVLAGAVREAWGHAISTGYVARRLAEVVCPTRAEVLGLAGVMHLLGLVGLLEAKLEGYASIVERARNGEANWSELELELLGFDHPRVARALARHLQAPPEIAGIVHGVGQPPALIDSLDTWCVAVASLSTQRYHSGFPRRRAPQPELESLAQARPDAWSVAAPILPDIFRAIEESQEIFNA